MRYFVSRTLTLPFTFTSIDFSGAVLLLVLCEVVAFVDVTLVWLMSCLLDFSAGLIGVLTLALL